MFFAGREETTRFRRRQQLKTIQELRQKKENEYRGSENIFLGQDKV